MNRTEELVNKWESRRDVQNLMGRYTGDFLIRRERDMLTNYWSGRDDISYGVNKGYYVGLEAVGSFYEGLHEYNILIGDTLKAALPEKTKDFTEDELYGMGLQDNKPICNQIVEVADDLQTAKGFWHCQGKYDALTKMGPLSYWTWGWFAGDFILEDGVWKIWHLLYLEDIHDPCGFQWGEERPDFKEEPAFAAAAEFRIPEPNIKETVREYYSRLRPYTPAPRIPEPYSSFAETFSYGKEAI